MYFKESEHIANTEKYPRPEVEKIDRFLAREHVSRFKLQDVVDKTDVRENAEAILDEFTKLRVVKPGNRYFCPDHKDEELKLRKSVVVIQRGYCHRCKKSYPLAGRETETYYRRIKTPNSWSNSEASKSQYSDYQREPPLWKDRRLHIALIPALIIASVALFTHFNSAEHPIPSGLTSSTSNTATAIVQADPSSTLTSLATPEFTNTAKEPKATDTVSPS